MEESSNRGPRWVIWAAGLVIVAAVVAVIALGSRPPTESSQSEAAVNNDDNTESALAQSESENPDDLTALPLEIPRGAEFEFATDFSIRSVDVSEILSGGPPKDGIPAVDDPKFVSVEEADAWLDAVEPVVLFEHNGEVKAYPIQILMWHEIVNDQVGGDPVAVTFCPLCNTAIAFLAQVDGQATTFGTSGRLRYSNLIMYDRLTESWWQQASGEAIIGEQTGSQLEFLPAAIVSWDQFKASHPESQVLSKETGFSRRYGSNPYVGYDDINQPPFLYIGPDTPGVLAPTARVITVDLNGETAAYPYDLMAEHYVINDQVGGQAVVVLWQSGVSSALDASSIAAGRDVGTAAVFSRELDGQTLTFVFQGGKILDEQTGSTWNLLGEAVAGQLAGQNLEPVVAINHFWFSWAAFKPETRVYTPEG